jgi:hypothetical protein
MPFAGKSVELEIMLNEISQTQKDKYQIVLIYVESRPKIKLSNNNTNVKGRL